MRAFAVKGVRDPVRVHELESVDALRSQLDVSRTRGFSRFVAHLIAEGADRLPLRAGVV